MLKERMAFLLYSIFLLLFVQIIPAQTALSDDSDAPFTITNPVVSVLSPNGGESWNSGEVKTIAWSLAGVVPSVSIDYSLDNGSSWIPVVAGIGNTGSYSWTVPDTPSESCLVRVSAASSSALSDVSDRVFAIAVSGVESVTAPGVPGGPVSGVAFTPYTFTASGAGSSMGHTVQYRFDWGDGTDSGWLEAGITSATHAWTSAGTCLVKAMARCSQHPDVESPWSGTLSVTIAPAAIDPGPAWNAFLGGSDTDGVNGIAGDGSGNIYAVGDSSAARALHLHPFHLNSGRMAGRPSCSRA